MGKPWIAAGAIAGALGVGLGAFGAHLLKAVLPLQMMTVFNTGVQYQLVHALALLATGILLESAPSRPGRLRAAAAAFTAGMVLFSGSLYLLATTGLWFFAWLTPVGGFCWIGGWSALASAYWPGAGAGGSARAAAQAEKPHSSTK